MGTYVIRKSKEACKEPWLLMHRYAEIMQPEKLNAYKTKKQAVTVARLLAGYAGKVEIDQ